MVEGGGDWAGTCCRSAFERQIANRFKVADYGRPGDRWLIDTVGLAWRTRILVHIESDLRLRLWQAAEDAAVQVFAGNLRDLLQAGALLQVAEHAEEVSGLWVAARPEHGTIP